MPCEVIGAFGLVPSSAPPPQPLSQRQSQQSDGDVRMRTRGWFEEIDDEGNSYFAHPDSADQVSTSFVYSHHQLYNLFITIVFKCGNGRLSFTIVK